MRAKAAKFKHFPYMLNIENWKAMKEALSSVQGVGVHLFTQERQIQSAEMRNIQVLPVISPMHRNKNSAGTTNSKVLFCAFALTALGKGKAFQVYTP